MLANPEAQLLKESVNRVKAPDGTFAEKTDFAESHSPVFRRLGLDLIQVNKDGSATIHARPEHLEQLISTVESLDAAGVREKVRWITLDSFDVIPPALRIDSTWLKTLKPHVPVDAVVELQPLLTRVEIDTVLRSIAALLKRNEGESLRGTGTDFSGRQWCRGSLTVRTLLDIARGFFSVQSLHPPLLCEVTASEGSRHRPALARETPVQNRKDNIDVGTLPCIATVDTGVPLDHLVLSRYRRGQYLAPDAYGQPLGDHGSFVASRAVFGDPDYSNGVPNATPVGQCSFFDIVAPADINHIDEKSILQGMAAVVATSPDVRVFNLSFDSPLALGQMNEIDRRERLLLVQDLDNFIFANDVCVVAAAGNSPRGLVPMTPYPNHVDDPNWGLGAWSRSFNSLTCGSVVERLVAGGLVTTPGWPSPFTKIGPGLCESPKPDFAAHGGNATAAYAFTPGLGVWGCNAAGMWEDRMGTSLAAPLLAREVAFALRALQGVCQQGARPFGVTAKAFLALTAIAPAVGNKVKKLADRTLGMGKASALRLTRPNEATAVMIWQGIIDGPTDRVRVQIPIPRSWLQRAATPALRIVFSWDTPVNAAVHNVWACRKISAQLRPQIDGPAIYSSHTAHRSYPLHDRWYDLRKLPDGAQTESDLWLLEIAYEEIADYYPAISFAPQQRVAFAAELIDASPSPVSPQLALQALPITATMQRLSVPPATSRYPVMIKFRP
jgi:hypothetical protein